MQLLPTIDGEAPTPGPIRALERWRVAWHGHRDATRLPPGEEVELPRPYLESLRAEAETGQRAVSAWLHNKIIPIDREAVAVLILLDQHRRDPAIAPEATPTRSAPEDADPQPMTAIPPWLREAREAAAARNAFARQVRERNEAEQRLGELGSTRHHLLEIARAAVHAHVNRYAQLAAHYDAALLRRQPNRRQAGAPAVSAEPWLHGDMPLLALDVEGELAESYRWFLKEFETRTSHRHRPILEEVPRAS
ncbi:MAG: hypothetical protein ACRDST_06725 [Pseudonocardiaceae bacterium]